MRKLLPILLLLTGCAPKKAVQPVAVSNTTTAIELCVVDTIAPGGMMNISASLIGSDTTVLQPEGRVPIQKAVEGPKVLGESKWITAHIITLRSSAGRVRYQLNGAPKTFAPGQISLLGMIRGTPIFARGAEGGPMRPEIESFAAKGSDMEKALSSSVRLRQQLSKVRFLYVPVNLVGCSFQAFARLRR